MKKRILSLLLVFVMVAGILPAGIITATAATTTVEVATWDELVYALQMATSVEIKLMADIERTVEVKEMSRGYVDYEYPQITVNGEKTIDLNSYSITVKDYSNAYSYDGGVDSYTGGTHRTLFIIPQDTSLTINDTGSNGGIVYNGRIISKVGGLAERQRYTRFAHRDIFEISGTLVINGGKFEAGNTEKQWILGGRKNAYYVMSNSLEWHTAYMDGDWFDSKYARQMVWGTVTKVNTDGTLVVNNGTLLGRGEGETIEYNPEGRTEDEITIKSYDRDSVIEYASGSTVIVNGGAVKALGGANVFEGEGNLTVNAGSFKTDKHDDVRCFDSEYGTRSNALSYSEETIISGSYGNIGIPFSAWSDNKYRVQFVKNGVAYNYFDSSNEEMDLNETGGQTSGESLEVIVAPYTEELELLYITGGQYNDSYISDGKSVYYNVSQPLSATVKYTPYYKDTTGIKNYSIKYVWRFLNELNLNAMDFSITTTENTIDIFEVMNSDAWEGHMGVTKLTCTIYETGYNIVQRVTTHSTKAVLTKTNTPLSYDALPSEYGMKVDVEYPEFSGLGSDIVMEVYPPLEKLQSDTYGACNVVYYYTYRDNMGDTTPITWWSDNYSSFGFDWGHVPVSVEMKVIGSDGIIKRFNASSWALKLPDIEPTGGSWNSESTVYIGASGNSVTLTASIDTRNALVEEDKILESDIVGWYKLTFDSYGDYVRNSLGGSGSSYLTVSENGLYCYAAYDRNGNIVVSKPVQVQFSEDAYSISIAKAGNYNFTVSSDGTTTYGDTVITATGGSSVTKSMVYWKVVGYPYGAEEFIKNHLVLNSTTSFTKTYADFFYTDDLLNIIPGDYTVQAFVKSGSQFISSSNTVTITVDRRANFADIIYNGKVVSNSVIEGSYVGTTMELSCVQGNGASSPTYNRGITWSIETLVGTDVATIDENGVLTINKPGQIKVTAKAKYFSRPSIATHTQTVTINIPITEVEVTLGTPTIGGDPSKIASVPADAPYELVYNPEYSWASGVSTNGEFLGNSIPELSVAIVPKDGYVFPARQLYLENGDESWYTYADEIVVKVNGTAYNFRDFEKTYTNGSTEYGKDYDGTFWDPQTIDFYWKWDRLIDPTHTYLDYVNLTVPIPAVGDNGDLAPDDEYAWALPECSNTDAIYSWVNDNGIYKVSGDYLNDNDHSNDNAVKMEDGETYQRGQMYRANIYFSTTNKNYTTYFGKNVTLMINGTLCQLTDIYYSTDVEGKTNGIAYYYFMPTAPIQTIENLYIADLEAPVGYRNPATADDITEFYTNFAIDDEVYVTRLTWFYDINNNGVIDSGEDTAFNADGSFMTGIPYSVYIELEARDQDGDGVGDYVKFANNTAIYLSSQSNAQMTGNQNGAVYKFPATTMPEKAVIVDPAQVTVELIEGYTGRPITTINVTSVGSTPLTSVVAEAEDSTILQVNAYDMKIDVLPADYGFEAGTYNTNVIIKDDSGNILRKVPVTIIVKEPAPDNITVTTVGEIEYTVSGQAVTVANDKTYKVGYLKDGVYVAVESTDNGDGTTTFTAPDSVSEVVLLINGDVTGDGKITVTDYVLIKSFLIQQEVLTEEQFFAADCDNSLVINSSDYMMLKSYLTGDGNALY